MTEFQNIFTKISKYAILSAQLLGYSPLSLRDLKETPKSSTSISTLRNLFQRYITSVLGIVVNSAVFFFVLNELSNITNSYDQAENDVLTVVILTLLATIIVLWNQIYGLLKFGKDRMLWKAHFYQLAIFYSLVNSKDHEWVKMKPESKRIFYNLLVRPIFLMCFTWFGHLLIAEILGTDKTPGYGHNSDWSVYGIIFGWIWMSFTYGHPISSIWLEFFPRLYSNALELLAERFTNENQEFPPDWENLSKAYDILVDLSDLYNSEMGLRLILESLYEIFLVLGYSYFVVVAFTGSQISDLVINLTCALHAFSVIYRLGNQGERVSRAWGMVNKELGRVQVHKFGAINRVQVVNFFPCKC